MANKNLFMAPMSVMNITQSYDGKTSHYPHMNSKTLYDFCIDLAGKDSGRDKFFCPVDELKVMNVYGVKKGGTNTVWCQSTKKVDFIDNTRDYITMQLTHMNDDDLLSLPVGHIFKRGEVMFREGKDGASGNHIHMSIRRGKYKAPGWAQNANGKWCCISTGIPIKPEEVIYFTPETVIKKTQGLTFPVLLNASVKYTTTARLNVRHLPSTSTGNVLKVLERNVKVSVIAISGKWGQLSTGGWICLDYVKEVKKTK